MFLGSKELLRSCFARFTARFGSHTSLRHSPAQSEVRSWWRKPKESMYALHLAASQGNYDMVRILLAP